ncbi:hypothetical protein EV126DRAFT_131190 [Verticillium dahliae]|nr:hypothetical protein EV126DRAFT_131190 [Verticillium dahliae]
METTQGRVKFASWGERVERVVRQLEARCIFWCLRLCLCLSCTCACACACPCHGAGAQGLSKLPLLPTAWAFSSWPEKCVCVCALGKGHGDGALGLGTGDLTGQGRAGKDSIGEEEDGPGRRYARTQGRKDTRQGSGDGERQAGPGREPQVD